MISVLITQTSGGRTGHKMKDLLTAFCLHFLLGWKILYDGSWLNKCNNKNNHDDHCNIFNLIKSSLVQKHDPKTDNTCIYEYQKTSWSGMSIDNLNKLKLFAENLEEKDGNVILRLTKATRVLPNQLYNWNYNDQFEKLLLYLRDLYFSDQNHDTFLNKGFLDLNDRLSITVHIRKGDVYNRVMHGFDHKDISYYKNIIIQLSKKFKNIPHTFNIISEKWKGYDEKDVKDLKKLDLSINSKINIYMDFCLYEYFTECINSDIIVVTNGQGSFSDLCILYSKNSSKILVCSELRQFEFKDDLNGKFIFCDKLGNFNGNF